jgi:RHS repeat-associated protein
VFKNSENDNENSQAAPEKSSLSAPRLSLPKGGGAIRGIGEKFAANPVTGTGSFTVPIFTSPGRSGFGPQLSLSYDSGSGNGPFGFGWTLSLPAITRKTDKGLPQYHDIEESDVFILSGAEDLVPVLDSNGQRETLPPRFVDGVAYRLQRYRPRIEGLFARIERWTRQDNGDIHWRSISKDNILTLYGKDANARIADSADPTRIFTWLICETRDDKGNGILYEYKAEDGIGVDVTQTHERNRGVSDDKRRSTNRYLKRIKYGNRVSLLDNAGQRQAQLSQAQISDAGWMFEVVLDYDDHDPDAPKPKDDEVRDPAGVLKYPWKPRKDPFSAYRAGFEIRTYRLCKRVLMFHHIPDLPVGEKGYDGLVRSTDFSYSHDQEPIYTFLHAATQSGYTQRDSGYVRRSLPPLAFEYSQPIVQDTVEDVDAESLENLPVGLDGVTYHWTDLHGEGIPGLLTEQANAWFYKRNLSPINVKPDNGATHTEAKFAAIELVVSKPNLMLSGGAEFMDLVGDGQPDLVLLEGPVPGFYEHDDAEGWQTFRPFSARLNVDMRDPNLKFIDLDGDGHADLLITEDDTFVWHTSLAEDGFGPANRVAQVLDEEKGPRLIFADGTQSVYLADLSGDGLTDLARIRNGEVCYWPNLGYGRFGAKVTMESTPDSSLMFDHADQFDHKRIRLADIDGSGTTDIIYLHRDGVRLYFNQSGNSWSAPQILSIFPRVDDLVSIVPIDLLGNGTACLVWSSPLPADARQPMRYVNLMGEQKPHLLIKTVNNLGAETRIQYAPSTKFYLQDKQAGKPWITKLPFPVHVVEKVTVTDVWRKTSFTTAYSYHHGYFDGEEREFRGFGRVEQVDVEDYGMFAAGNQNSPYITDDQTLYQPPVKTVTWYHTGAFLDHEQITHQFQHEYFPNWFDEQRLGQQVLVAFHENALPEPDLKTLKLTAEEWREALRACKGMLLRQEVYELDVDALVSGVHERVKLFSSAYHNCHIQLVQPRAANPHAVFQVTESEAITYHYELDLRAEKLTPDPRIAHTLNLSIDEYGNIEQTVAVVYPRQGKHVDATLENGAEKLIQQLQAEAHVAYTENRYTQDIVPVIVNGELRNANTYRLRLPCEVLTYELSGILPPNPPEIHYLTLRELRRFKLSAFYQVSGEDVPEIAYHVLSAPHALPKRLVEQVRTLYFKDDPADPDALQSPLPFRELGHLALPYETYQLALTEEFLNIVFEEGAGSKLERAVGGVTTVRAQLNDPAHSGYLSGTPLTVRFPDLIATGQYWIRSGIAGFASNAARNFYLPERYTDAFGSITTLDYDNHALFIQSSVDAVGNTTRVTRFDYRVIAPAEIEDPNGNHTEAAFDILGRVIALAVKGKLQGLGWEGDDLSDFDLALSNPSEAAVAAFLTNPAFDVAQRTQARTWLGRASSRFIYHFGEARDAAGNVTAWADQSASACIIQRETHASQPNGAQSLLHIALECSDGSSSVLMHKAQAEPEPGSTSPRWVVNGLTVFNNKGKPVKQYEPAFSDRFGCEMPLANGVTPVMYYDAVGRLVRTELPNGTLSRIEFSPWHVTHYDANDTVRGSDWFVQRGSPDPTQPLPAAATPETRAAWLTAHHDDTPALTFLDSLGREVVTVAHNRSANVLDDEKYITFTRLDTEGKPLWVQDARRNRVMQYINPPLPQGALPFDDPHNLAPQGFTPCYDIAGNLLYQHSMDAGERWILNDAAGKPMFAWNSRNFFTRLTYDSLHRPTASFVSGTDPANPVQEVQFEKLVYGEGQPDDQLHNLRGQPYQHFDTAGVVTTEAYDFKGNSLRTIRQFAVDYKTPPDWLLSPALEAERFLASTRYDALNRPIQIIAPHLTDAAPLHLNITQPGYNEAGLLERVDVWLNQSAEPPTLLAGSTASQRVVTNLNYNAKGQRVLLQYGNGAETSYDYEPDTFRLKRLQTKRASDDAVLQDLSYTYDPVGNVTQIGDAAQDRVFHSNQCVLPGAEYRYDALYRLIAASGREHKGDGQPYDWDDSSHFVTSLPNDCLALQNYIEQYRYDSVGNLMRVEHHAGRDLEQPGLPLWNRRYQYARDSNRLLATSLPGDPANLPDYAAVPGYSGKYTYDVHGNMTAMPHLTLMQWDFRDQLSATSRQVVNSTPPPARVPETTFYVYDAAGQRVRKITETQTGARSKQRIYLGGFEVYREYSGGVVALERESLHVMDNQQRVALIETLTIQNQTPIAQPQPLVRYQLGNHLGSVSLELDAGAAVITYEEYTPYGSTAYCAGRNAAEVSLKRYRYTGKERDHENGFTYHGARYYAPWLGRWISCDPIGLKGGINLFAFTRGNPISYVDRTGRNSEKAQRALESLKQAAKEVIGLLKEDFSAREKVVESQTKLDERQYQLNELKSEEIKRGLVSNSNQERQIKQAEHNLEQAERNLTGANSHLAKTEGQLASANARFAKAQRAAANVGVSANEVADITINLEKEFKSILDEAEMNRPDWRDAAKKGSGPKGGGSGGSAPPHAGSGGGTMPPTGNSSPSSSAEGSKSAVKEGQAAAKEEVAAVTAGEKALVIGAEKSSLKTGLRFIGKATPIIGAGFAGYLVGKDVREKRYARAVVDAVEGVPLIGDVVLGGELGVDALRFGINMLGDLSVSMNQQIRDAGK